MMKKYTIMALFLALVIVGTGCQRNYYSGTGKGSNCGCPGNPR